MIPVEREECPIGVVPAGPSGAAAELRGVGFRRVRGPIITLADRFETDTYLAVLEGWIESELFEALHDSRRERLRRAIAKRLAQVPRSDFVWRRPLVSVVGDRPGG